MCDFKSLLFLLLLFLPLSHADGMKEGENYCHDTKSVEQNKALLGDHPNDPIIIRLMALREGLCNMIDRGLITVEQGIDIFNDEKNKSVIQRSNEEQTKSPKLTL
ncbi:MAG: hypothetical protein HOO92_07550 [Methylococcaceae bacterium]|nr:hypothetical protein [Methylococcaceae bacterium]